MTDNSPLCGQKFGRWTALEDYELTPRGERKRLCRCDCGTERYVLERSLKSGGSKSCGCLARERSRDACAYDLLGKTFGDLIVVGKSKKRTKMGAHWTCLCRCGYTCEATATELVTGRKTHCGCKTVKKYPFVDVTGQRFGRLTALRPTENRDGSGNRMWKCRCDCGKEVEVSYNDIAHGHQKSCGCQRREHEQKLGQYLSRVDGTCIDILKSKKLPSNNTTGVKGVYLVKGRYLAKIVFQKRQYVLGTYDSLEEAARARKIAEETLTDEVVSFYAQWQQKAEADPAWAKENPIRIYVRKRENSGLQVALEPVLA